MPTHFQSKPLATGYKVKWRLLTTCQLPTSNLGRVREEARRLNLAGFGLGLGNDQDTVQANMARQYRQPPHIFPSKKPTIVCWHCGFQNHSGEECHKHIAEEYFAKQAKRQQQNQQQNQQQRGNSRGRGGRGSKLQSANVTNEREDSPAYGSIS